MSGRNNGISTVLFDLDGTLVDTAPDMVAALERVCAENGTEAPDYADARRHVSQGAIGLIRHAFGAIPATDARALAERFRDVYAEQVSRGSRLFEGMADLLDALEQAGRNWGVVTNKPARFTAPLLADLGLDVRAACVVSGDTTVRSKPHPLPLLYACERLGRSPGECVYVGDDQRDVIAGKAAGMLTVAALYGYILTDEEPLSWQADGTISSPGDLLGWFESRAQ